MCYQNLGSGGWGPSPCGLPDVSQHLLQRRHWTGCLGYKDGWAKALASGLPMWQGERTKHRGLRCTVERATLGAPRGVEQGKGSRRARASCFSVNIGSMAPASPSAPWWSSSTDNGSWPLTVTKRGNPPKKALCCRHTLYRAYAQSGQHLL